MLIVLEVGSTRVAWHQGAASEWCYMQGLLVFLSLFIGGLHTGVRAEGISADPEGRCVFSYRGEGFQEGCTGNGGIDCLYEL